MANTRVSTDALFKVKSALQDYQLDISGLNSKINKQISEIFQVSNVEIQKITKQIDITTSKINQLQGQIKQLEETINNLNAEIKSAEKKLAKAQDQLHIKQNDVTSLKEKIAQIIYDEIERMNAERYSDDGSTSYQRISHSYAQESASPSSITQMADGMINSVIQRVGGGLSPDIRFENVGAMLYATSEEFVRTIIREYGYSPGALLQRLKYHPNFNYLMDKLDETETQIKLLQKEISDLQKLIPELQKKRDEAQSEKTKKEDELHFEERLLDRLKSKHERMKTALSKMKDELNILQAASKSFQSKAESQTGQNIGNIDKCISAIEEYLNG